MATGQQWEVGRVAKESGEENFGTHTIVVESATRASTPPDFI
jgi:hypothetical protein